MARLFVAVWPPRQVVDQLQAIDRPAVSGVRWTHEDQWHVTLSFLGEAEVAAASQALADIEAPIEPVSAELGPALTRLGQRVLVLPVAGLDDLAARVRRATLELGPTEDPKPFSGHLTLARVKPSVRRTPSGEAFAATFPVREIALVASRLDADRARYQTVATRAL